MTMSNKTFRCKKNNIVCIQLLSHCNTLKYSAISQYQVRLTSWRDQARRGKKIQKQEKKGRL